MVELKSMKHQMLMRRKKLHQRIETKMWFMICLIQNLETMSFVNMMAKFGWHSSALTMKSLMILKLNFCIRVNIIKYYCYPETEGFCHLDKNTFLNYWLLHP